MDVSGWVLMIQDFLDVRTLGPLVTPPETMARPGVTCRCRADLLGVVAACGEQRTAPSAG